MSDLIMDVIEERQRNPHRIQARDLIIGIPLFQPPFPKTADYRAEVARLHAWIRVKTLIRVTDGLVGSLHSILPDGLGAEIDHSAWQHIAWTCPDHRPIPIEEMFTCFNMGLGMIAVLHAEGVCAVPAHMPVIGYVTAIPGIYIIPKATKEAVRG